LEPEVLSDIYDMTAAEFEKQGASNHAFADQVFVRCLKEKVVAVDGYVQTTANGMYSNHTCDGLRVQEVAAEIAKSPVKVPPRSASRLPLSPGAPARPAEQAPNVARVASA
jgi:hypothetical protein